MSLDPAFTCWSQRPLCTRRATRVPMATLSFGSPASTPALRLVAPDVGGIATARIAYRRMPADQLLRVQSGFVRENSRQAIPDRVFRPISQMKRSMVEQSQRCEASRTKESDRWKRFAYEFQSC